MSLALTSSINQGYLNIMTAVELSGMTEQVLVLVPSGQVLEKHQALTGFSGIQSPVYPLRIKEFISHDKPVVRGLDVNLGMAASVFLLTDAVNG